MGAVLGVAKSGLAVKGQAHSIGKFIGACMSGLCLFCLGVWLLYSSVTSGSERISCREDPEECTRRNLGICQEDQTCSEEEETDTGERVKKAAAGVFLLILGVGVPWLAYRFMKGVMGNKDAAALAGIMG